MIVLGFYRHYKGGVYEVVGTALHESTHEVLVLYRPLIAQAALIADFWARPQTQFEEMVENLGHQVSRFTFLGTTCPE